MKEKPSFAYINEISEGDAVFKENIIGIFKKEIAREIESYRQHLKNENYPETSEVVHKLSHKIKILDLKKGFRVAEKYSIQLKDSNQNLKMEFEHVLNTLLLFLKKA